MKRIAVYVPKSAAIEAISPSYRVFKTANMFLTSLGKAPMFEIEYVGLERKVLANDGEYIVKIDRLLNEVTDIDLVIIPALYGQMSQAIALNKAAIPWIKTMHKKGAEVASLCLGAFLLGATGLIDGKKCSTHWAYYNEFSELYPNVQVGDGTIITDEGNLYSSGGANSIWNLLLYLVEKYVSRDIAILTAKYFAIDIDRDSQGVFTIFSGQKDHNDDEILKTQQFIELNFSKKITIDELAAKVNLSRRSFERRFKQATSNTVLEYTQRVKIEAAKKSFEASRKNVTEVMFNVGYTDNKAFRDVFKKVTGITPIEYRNKYSKVS